MAIKISKEVEDESIRKEITFLMKLRGVSGVP